MPEPLPPYTRQPDETEEAFYAFTIYRDLGAARSLDAVEARLRAERDTEGSTGAGAVLRVVSNDTDSTRSTAEAPRKHRKSGLVGKWSSTHGWVERAAAWDRYVDEQIRGRQLDEIESMARRHAQQAQLVGDVMLRPVVEFARVLADPMSLAVVASINDPLAPLAKLITSAGVTALYEMANEAAKRLPAIQQAERLARGVRVLDAKEGPTQGGTAVWQVETYQPPREGGELELGDLNAPEVPEWDGDTVATGEED